MCNILRAYIVLSTILSTILQHCELIVPQTNNILYFSDAIAMPAPPMRLAIGNQTFGLDSPPMVADSLPDSPEITSNGPRLTSPVCNNYLHAGLGLEREM